MANKRTLSMTAMAILKAIAAGYRYGFDIMDVTGLPSGTVYPALSRLERDGLLQFSWEDPQIAQREKRPPRKYYEVTPDGRSSLDESIRRFEALQHIEPADERAEAQS
jgi:DNA-binding PadR family transcriptional regulator